MFDIKSSFTNGRLNELVDILLQLIYIYIEIKTDLTKKQFKEPILLLTRNVHYSCNNLMYKQVDDVTMGSPLEPILAGIFLSNLKEY